MLRNFVFPLLEEETLKLSNNMTHRTLLATLCCSKRKIAGWGETALFHGSPDFMSLDSVFWGYIKIAVYDVVGQVDSSGTLKHRITVATGTVTTVTYI
jgi:hypothetical protein